MYSDQMRKTHTPYSVFDVYELLQTGAAKYTARARIARVENPYSTRLFGTCETRGRGARGAWFWGRSPMPEPRPNGIGDRAFQNEAPLPRHGEAAGARRQSLSKRGSPLPCAGLRWRSKRLACADKTAARNRPAGLAPGSSCAARRGGLRADGERGSDPIAEVTIRAARLTVGL
jgi:hypothetical protein